MDKINSYKHHVSELLVDLLNHLDNGRITKEDIFAVVDGLERCSIDETQREFFGAYRLLTEKVADKKYGE